MRVRETRAAIEAARVDPVLPAKAPHLARRHASIACPKARCLPAPHITEGSRSGPTTRDSPKAHCRRPARRRRIAAGACDPGLHPGSGIHERASTPAVQARLAAASQASTILFRFVQRRRQDHRPGIERPRTPAGLINGITDPDRPAAERTGAAGASTRCMPCLIAIRTMRRIAPCDRDLGRTHAIDETHRDGPTPRASRPQVRPRFRPTRTQRLARTRERSRFIASAQLKEQA